MKLELNEILQEIYSWKNLLKVKDEEIENLQNQLLFANKQNEVLENSRSSLFHEIAELNSVVTSLRNSLRKIENFEGDRKILLEEKQKLKTSLETREKLYQKQIKDVKQEIQKVKEINKQETEKLISHIKNEAFKETETLRKELVKKENDVEKLKKEIAKLLNEREEVILKIKIQYEDKIGKLKQQIPKSKVQTSYNVQMHDIFRQKYLKLEKESVAEISKLREEIQSIKLSESLKSKSGHTSLSSALLKSNQSIKTTAEVSIQTENAFTELSWKFKKIQDNNNDDDDFVVKNKSLNKTQPVLPQKRKLFNINENYYIK